MLRDWRLITLSAAVLATALAVGLFGAPAVPGGRAQTRAPASPVGRPAGDVREPGQSQPPQSEESSPGPTVTLQILDVATRAPIPGVRGVALQSRHASPRIPFVTDLHGRLTVAFGEDVRLMLDGPRRKLVAPTALHPNRYHGATVWTYEFVTVSGRIALGDPDRLGEAKQAARVVGRLVAQVSGKWTSDHDEIGSPAWFRNNAGKAETFEAAIDGDRYCIDVPALGEVGLVAVALGHRVASCLIHTSQAVDGALTQDIYLPAAPVIALEVLEEANGAPIANAVVTCMVKRHSTFSGTNGYVEELCASVVGAALGARGSPVTQHAELTYTTTIHAGAGGQVRFENPFECTSLVLIVRAPEYEAFESHWLPEEGSATRTVRMKKRGNMPSRYRLSYKGQIVMRVTVQGVESAVNLADVLGCGSR